MESAIHQEFVRVDGIKTFVAKAGSGAPVLLIHGASPGASSLVNWKLEHQAPRDGGLYGLRLRSAGIRLHRQSLRLLH